MNDIQVRRQDVGLPGNGGQYAATSHGVGDPVDVSGATTAPSPANSGELCPNCGALIECNTWEAWCYKCDWYTRDPAAIEIIRPAVVAARQARLATPGYMEAVKQAAENSSPAPSLDEQREQVQQMLGRREYYGPHSKRSTASSAQLSFINALARKKLGIDVTRETCETGTKGASQIIDYLKNLDDLPATKKQQ